MEYGIQCTCIKIQQLGVSKKLKHWIDSTYPHSINILALKSSYKHAYTVHVYRSRVNTFSFELI